MIRFIIRGPKGNLVGRGNRLTIAKNLPALVKDFGSVTISRDVGPEPVPAPVTMYDSTDVAEIPTDAVADAGYVGGNWPTFPVLVRDHPKRRNVSIAVSTGEDADFLDIENGNATIADAAGWFKRQVARGVRRPGFYISVSDAPKLIAALAAEDIRWPAFKLWTAHYTGVAHLCSKTCGFDFGGVADATQYTDKALGRNLDASLCRPNFFSEA